MKISHKIALIFLSLSLVAFSALGFFMYSSISKAIKTEVGNGHTDLAASILSGLDRFMDEQMSAVESVATGNYISNYLNNPDSQNTTELKQSFTRRYTVYDSWESFALFDSTGKLLETDNDNISQALFDHMAMGKHGLSAHCSDVYLNDKDSSAEIYVISPIERGGKTLGYLAIIIDWTKVIPLIGSGETSQIHLLNSAGLELAESGEEDMSYILQEDYSQQAFYKDHIANNKQLAFYFTSSVSSESGDDDDDDDDAAGQRFISVARERGFGKHSGHGWLLYLEDAEADVLLPARQEANKMIVLLFGVGLVLMALLSRLVYLTVVVPVKKISQAVKNIAGGDFAFRCNYKNKDEFGELGHGLNTLAENLGELYSNLEEKVKEKTINLVDKIKEVDRQKELLQNNQTAVINVLEDVKEEQLKAEGMAHDLEKFKLAVENASDHIVITDPEGIVIYANSAMERITGFKLKQVIGQKAGSVKLWGGLMPKEHYTKLWEIIKIKKQIYFGEVNNKRKNGEVYIAAVSIAPVLGADKEIKFFVGIERDVTKEREIDKSKTEFVSLASHQLRTPLSAINWYTEMLLNGDAGEINADQKMYLDEIYHGNQRMVDLVNALLNVSRLDLGTFIIEPEMVDTAALGEEVAKDLQPKINAKAIKFKTKFQKGLMVNLDRKLSRIILDNLTSNAVKYTPEKGTVEFTISSDKKDLIIEVKDTGYGIPESDQAKIFTKLFRAENVREKETDGTGLGLYMVKSIIEAGGGTVNFVSVLDQGTTFTVKIPLSGMTPKGGTRALD